MITLAKFRYIEAAVRKAGYGRSIDWSENVKSPGSAEAFAAEAIYVICNSGMRNSVAQAIYERCLLALRSEKSCKSAFGHPGKSAAIEKIWNERERYFAEYSEAEEKLEMLARLPWIGTITRFHLARNLGADFAKPDVHLNRLANAENTTAQALCERLAAESGYRVGTVDLILWRACANGIISSGARSGKSQGSQKSDRTRTQHAELASEISGSLKAPACPPPSGRALQSNRETSCD